MPVDMREWLPEDDLVFVVLDAVATLDLGEFRRRYRADGHGRAGLCMFAASGCVPSLHSRRSHLSREQAGPVPQGAGPVESGM